MKAAPVPRPRTNALGRPWLLVVHRASNGTDTAARAHKPLEQPGYRPRQCLDEKTLPTPLETDVAEAVTVAWALRWVPRSANPRRVSVRPPPAGDSACA